jgi:hypothetical protein
MLRQRELRKIFDNLANSNWQLAVSQKRQPRKSTAEGGGATRAWLNPTPNWVDMFQMHANLCPFTRKPRVNGARLGWVGMTSLNPTPIWDDRGEGEGWPREARRSP